MADPQFSRGDLVWFDPGIGYVLPGEVTEFHPQAQVSSGIYILVFGFGAAEGYYHIS